jgi:hypothetical protein
VVNADDLVVFGRHGGGVDVFAQWCSIVDNNSMKKTLLIMVFLIKTQFMLFILVMFLPWARLLLVFFFCKIKLVANVSPSIFHGQSYNGCYFLWCCSFPWQACCLYHVFMIRKWSMHINIQARKVSWMMMFWMNTLILKMSTNNDYNLFQVGSNCLRLWMWTQFLIMCLVIFKIAQSPSTLLLIRS